MQHRIIGNTMPVLEIGLDNGEKVFAESGELAWLSSTVQMQTSTSAGGQASGFFATLGRVISGGSLFMTEYTTEGGPGTVTFATKMPGQIQRLDVSPEMTYMVHRHGFMCAVNGVQLEVGFQRKFGAGVFGGEGFTMQKISGQGIAFVELYGEVITYDLAAGETMRCLPGFCGMFEQTVTMSVTTVPGLANKLFGGDGIFLLALTGPGKIWLQSMTLPNLAHAISPYLPDEK